jgi:NAD-dependent deacetylase
METMDIVEKLGITINPECCVVVLTGAGISLESGVPIFRGKGSMWEIPEAKRLADKAGPPWNTKESWEFYEWRRKLVKQCQPNAAHYTLCEMEKYFESFWLITQNVDGLHTRAGCKNILELHGDIWKGRCVECESIVKLPETPLKSLPPHCSCGYPLRPHVVQFGETLDHNILNKAFMASKKAELFFIIGTSGVVSPASEMPLMARERGAPVIEINTEPTVLTPHMSLSIRGKAAEALPKLWKERLLKGSV